MAQEKKKLRILCLHGMAQNALYFEKKTAGILQDLKDRAELGENLLTNHKSNGED